MDVIEFIPQDEPIKFQRKLTFKQSNWIEIGFTDKRYFVLERSKSHKGFISAKNLDTISIQRQRITAKMIISIVLLLIVTIVFTVYPILIFLAPIFLVLLLSDIVAVILISRRQYLMISIGKLKRFYRTKITNLQSVKEAIALIHSYGKNI